MAAMLNGFLPLRKKESDHRVLNTRWGDAAITAPMQGGWNAHDLPSDQPEISPDLDRDLPPTPPQDHFEGQDGVFIVEDDDETDEGTGKESITVTIPLPWKKKKPSSHIRKSSYNSSVLNPRFAAAKRMDIMPPLGTTEAAAIPLPDSRVSSPVGRAATTSPVLNFSPAMSFRTRLASPSLGDILSPVAEGFAKEGPTHRPAPVLSPLQYAQTIQADRPSTASSIRSNASRRPSINGHTAEGLKGSTMSSQAIVTEQAPEFVRPPSRGIGSSACMRASSRGPRASSRGPRAPSVEPFMRRAQSVEPSDRRAPSVEPFARRAPSVEPINRRAPSVEPVFRRAPSVEPIARRAPSVEPMGRRAPSVEPVTRGGDTSLNSTLRHTQPLDEGTLHRREPSVGPNQQRRDPSPFRRRAPSAEPTSRRAPSVGPYTERRAASREPRGRRGFSVEPLRVRFRSEAPYRHRRGDSDSSANDASADSDSEAEAHSGRQGRFNRFEKDSKSSGRSYRRRSIASPITSPVNANFNIAETVYDPIQPVQYNGMIDPRMTMSAGPGFTRPTPPPASTMAPTPPPMTQHVGPRARSISRTRGLYGDMQDDFRLLARDVHIATNVPIQPSALERVPSPVTYQQSSGIAAALGQSRGFDYGSDTSLPRTHYEPASAFSRERADRYRRDEREKARETLVRKLERDRETMLSSDESVVSGSESKTRKVFGGSGVVIYDAKASGKTMVPDAEEIWG